MAYYNEIDAYPAQWMRNLIDAGHIAPGVVDNRSIADVTPEDIGDGQAHFFAGIGVWSLALRWAGVPDGAAVWTGSCPCQPFSTAGKRRGSDDERHLWPVWFRLIEQRRPSIVFGEQVAGRDGLEWLDAVSADMEGAGYSIAAANLCAAGVGSPHGRQRLFFVASSPDARGIGASRLRAPVCAGPVRSGGAFGAEDLRSLYADPFGFEYSDGESGVLALADGVASRVGRLRAYGNAINARVAAVFIRSALDAIEDL